MKYNLIDENGKYNGNVSICNDVKASFSDNAVGNTNCNGEVDFGHGNGKSKLLNANKNVLNIGTCNVRSLYQAGK